MARGRSCHAIAQGRRHPRRGRLAVRSIVDRSCSRSRRGLPASDANRGSPSSTTKVTSTSAFARTGRGRHATEMRRDADRLFDEDTFGDPRPFHDSRNGYHVPDHGRLAPARTACLRRRPKGAGGHHRKRHRNWDGVWDAAAHIAIRAGPPRSRFRQHGAFRSERRAGLGRKFQRHTRVERSALWAPIPKRTR